MTYNTPGLGSIIQNALGSVKMGGKGQIASPVGNGANLGNPQTGYKLVSFTNIAMGSTTVPFSQTNIKPPNGYALSNLQLKLVVTDTTGGSSAPVTPASIESALTNLNIIGSSGRPIMAFKPTTGDTTRWQSVLNDGYIYQSAPTPADTSTSTAYSKTWTPVYKHLVIDPSELKDGFEISGYVNVLASRAATLNSMTSTVTELSIFADFVPVSGYVRTQYRTKNATGTTSAYLQLGNSLDNAVNTILAADFGADAALSDSATFYLAQNGNTLIPYTSYTSITSVLSSYPTAGSNSSHIDGFFPMQVLYKAAVDSNVAVDFEANISGTAPTGGGISNNVVLYQAEQY